MKQLESYVTSNLSLELREIINSERKNEFSEITDYEKAIIYKYTEDGYISVNEGLRNSNGKYISNYSKFLTTSLKKLPNYKLLCYRAATLTKADLQKYEDAYKNNSILIEHTFLSSSKSQILARYFPHNTLFIIKSRNGKDIEKIAKFGLWSGQNEKEVLFVANSKFEVLEMSIDDKTSIITLEEK
jgi:hypothetical protein